MFALLSKQDILEIASETTQIIAQTLLEEKKNY